VVAAPATSRYHDRVDPFAALGRLLWSVRGASKLAFLAAAIVTGWLLIHCSDLGPPEHADAPPPHRFDDERPAAIQTSRSLSAACFAGIQAAFQRDAIAGLVPGKPPAARAPANRGELARAAAFEVAIKPDGDVATCAPTGVLPIHALQDTPLNDIGAREANCGRDPDEALSKWTDAAAPSLLAMLRAPKQPPPLVVYYWRWCDGSTRPYTCSVGLTWMRIASRTIVATAAGVGTADPRRETARDEAEAYVEAMQRAEDRLAKIVLGWK